MHTNQNPGISLMTKMMRWMIIRMKVILAVPVVPAVPVDPVVVALEVIVVAVAVAAAVVAPTEEKSLFLRIVNFAATM